MDGSEVALAAIGVLASVVAGMVWLLKKLFTQNDTTIKENNKVIKELTGVLQILKDTLSKDDKSRREFEAKAITTLDKISSTQDTIYDNVTTTSMTVQNLYVMHEEIKCGKKDKEGK